MHINWIKLHGVGPFKQTQQLQLKEGLNVILGQNEAGKSTFMRGIEALYFGFKPVKDWKYANWDASETIIEGELHETEDIQTHVTRRYGTRIRASLQRGHLAEALGNSPFLETRIDLELYKSMFSMSTDELSNIGKKSWKELNDSLTDNYNSTLFRTAHEVVTELESKASTLYKESGRGQYEMKRQKEEEKELSEGLAQLQIEHAYAVKSEDEKKQLKSELSKVESQLSLLDQQLLSQEQFKQAILRKNEMQKVQGELRELGVMEVPDRPALEGYKMARERLGQLKMQKQQLLAEQLKLEADLIDLEQQPALPHKGRSIAAIGLAFAAVLLTGGMTLYMWPNGLSQSEMQLLGGLIGVSVLSIAYIRAGAYLRLKKAKVAQTEQKHEYQGQYQNTRKSLFALEEDIQQLAELNSVVFDWLEAHEDMSFEQADAYRLRLDYLMQRHSELLRDINEEHSYEKAPVASGAEGETLEQLLHRKNELTSQKVELEKLLQHQTNLTAKEIEYKINEMEQKQHLATQKLWETALERDRMMFVSKIVAAAEQSYRHSQRPDFLLKASRYMKVLTAGRYEEILMTEAGGFVLKSGNHLTPVGDSTSRGTKEQMYLSIKTALMSRLDPLGQLPLLLDETAINFDEHRRSGFYKMLAEIAQERQVVLTTCHKWLVEEMTAQMEIHLQAIGADECAYIKNLQEGVVLE